MHDPDDAEVAVVEDRGVLVLVDRLRRADDCRRAEEATLATRPRISRLAQREIERYHKKDPAIGFLFFILTMSRQC